MPSIRTGAWNRLRRESHREDGRLGSVPDGLIESIAVRPPARGSFEIEFAGDTAANRQAASNETALPDAYRSSVKVLTGAGSVQGRTDMNPHKDV